MVAALLKSYSWARSEILPILARGVVLDELKVLLVLVTEPPRPANQKAYDSAHRHYQAKVLEVLVVRVFDVVVEVLLVASTAGEGLKLSPEVAPHN